jgi:hypothetical protein
LILGYRRITARASVSCGSREWVEINDHPFEQSSDKIRLIAIHMKGVFGNEGALPLVRPMVVLAARRVQRR